MIALFVLHSKTKKHCGKSSLLFIVLLNHIIFENRQKIMTLFNRFLFKGCKELLLFFCPGCVQSSSQNRKTIKQVNIPGNEENYIEKMSGSWGESISNITQAKTNVSLMVFYLWQQIQLRQDSSYILLRVCPSAVPYFPSSSI